MTDQQRQGFWAMATLMNEMNIMACDGGFELLQSVDTGFGFPPVELMPPVIHHPLQGGEAGAILPGFGIQLIGPARPVQPFVQIRQGAFADMQRKRRDGRYHFDAPERSRPSLFMIR